MIKRKTIYIQSDLRMLTAVLQSTALKGVYSKFYGNCRLGNNAITSGMEPANDMVKTGIFLFRDHHQYRARCFVDVDDVVVLNTQG